MKGELSTPPAGPVWWLCVRGTEPPTHGCGVGVWARSWFEARGIAATVWSVSRFDVAARMRGAHERMTAYVARTDVEFLRGESEVRGMDGVVLGSDMIARGRMRRSA